MGLLDSIKDFGSRIIKRITRPSPARKLFDQLKNIDPEKRKKIFDIKVGGDKGLPPKNLAKFKPTIPSTISLG